MKRVPIISICYPLILSVLVCTLTCAQRQRPQYEPEYHEVSLAYETPHTKWAKPLAGGPLRVLFIGPRGVMREVVEVAQRLSIEYEEVIVHTRHQLGGDPATGYQAIIGGLPQDITDRLREKLRQQYDVIVVGNIEWRILPEEIEYEILRKTRDGCGLVLSLINQQTDHLNIFLERSKPELGLDYVTAGIPFAGLDQWRDLGADAGSKLVSLRRFGRGRIAWLNIGSSSAWSLLTPPVGNSVVDRWWLWDYYLSLPLRAIVWAARREPAARLASLQIIGPDGKPTATPTRSELPHCRVAVAWQNVQSLKRPQVTLRVRGPDGEDVILQEATAQIREGQISADFHLSALVQRQHFADVWLKNGKEVVDWGSVSFTPQGRIALGSLKVARASVGPDDSCTVNCLLTESTTHTLTLAGDALDPYGRLVARSTTIIKSGETEAMLHLPTRNLLANAIRIRVSLRLGGNEIDRLWVWQPVANPIARDDFSFLVWAGPGDEFVPYYVGKVLAGYGVDTINHGSGIALARHGLRGTPGIRAGLHFNECNVKNHVRTPCLNDPAHRQVVRERLLGVARDHVRFGATAYTLGDDNILATQDVCFSDFCKADFRQYLRDTYGTLDALNAEWDTRFTTWDEVVPILLEDARKEAVQHPGRLAQWADHRMHMESVWANFHRFALETVREVDPTARVGSDAACGSGSFGGYDWWKLSKVLTLWNVYPDPIQVEAMRCFRALEAYTGIWYGGYLEHRYEALERWAPWYSIFHQLSAAWWFQSFPSAFDERCQELAVASDLTAFQPFITTAREIAEIKRGIGKLLLSAKRNHDGVAMHYSQASVHASTIDGRLGQTERARRAWVDLLEDVGLQYDFIASEQIEQGELMKRGYRVLVLPASYAVSDKEIAAITQFAEAGGNVVCDVRPGVRDGHCRPVSSPERRRLFGVYFQTNGARGEPVDVEGNFILGELQIPYVLKKITPDNSIMLESGTVAPTNVSVKKGEPPLHLLRHQLGRGSILLLNFPIEGYVKAKPVSNWLRQLVHGVMRTLGAKPLAEVRSTDGEPMDVEQVTFTDGGAHYLGLTRWHSAEKVHRTFSVTLDRKPHIYNIRVGKYLGSKEGFEVSLKQGESALFALLPHRVTDCHVTAPPWVARGHVIKVQVMIAEPQPRLRHVVHVEMLDPKGVSQRHYALNVAIPAETASADIQIPTALNESMGKWKLIARDVATGEVGAAIVEVK